MKKRELQRRLYSAVFKSGTITSAMSDKKKKNWKETEGERGANPYFYHDAVSVVSV